MRYWQDWLEEGSRRDWGGSRCDWQEGESLRVWMEVRILRDSWESGSLWG